LSSEYVIELLLNVQSPQHLHPARKKSNTGIIHPKKSALALAFAELKAIAVLRLPWSYGDFALNTAKERLHGARLEESAKSG
jgi:hypothetical protein